MVRFWQKVVLGVLSLLLALEWLPIYAQTPSPNRATNDYTYGECSRIEAARLRSEIETAAYNVLAAPEAAPDLATLVERKWIELDVDTTIDQEVARAVAAVAANEGYFSRLWSGWSAERAEEFATRIADDAFSSPAFTAKINQLSAAIAGEIASDLEADFARAASAAFLCMKAYIGDNYSATLFSAFERQIDVQVATVDVPSEAEVDVSVLDVHNKALGGVGVIVVTEIARRITQRLSQRIAERVAGRIVSRVLGRAGSSLLPIAGWVIGLGLIVWDLWEGGKGALPQIEEALTSEEVKERIRSEISDSIQNSLPDETAVVALEIAVTLLEEWEGFCGRYPDVCSLAEENATFQAILNDTPLAQLDQLALLVQVLINFAGRAELTQAIASGQFEIALALPIESYVIIQNERSLAPLLAWSQLAGDRLNEVLTYGLHRHKQPADFTPELLQAVLDVADQAAIDKLLTLERAELALLVPFAASSLGPLALNMSAAELEQLVGYLQAPPAEATSVPAAELAPRLANREVTMQELLQPTAPPTDLPTATAPSATESPVPAGGVAGNGVVVASLIVLGLILLVAGALWWRRRSQAGNG